MKQPLAKLRCSDEEEAEAEEKRVPIGWRDMLRAAAVVGAARDRLYRKPEMDVG